MKAIVISSPEGPVEALEIPDSTSTLELAVLSQSLDHAGVDFEVVAVSRNATVTQLTTHIERILATKDACADCDEDLCDECPLR